MEPRSVGISKIVRRTLPKCELHSGRGNVSTKERYAHENVNGQEWAFTSEDLEIITAIVENDRMAVESARLPEQTDAELRRRIWEFASLAQLSTALSASSDLDRSLEVAVIHAGQALQASMCDICLVEDDRLTVRTSVGYRSSSLEWSSVKVKNELCWLFEECQPLAVTDLECRSVLPARWRKRVLGENARAYLGVPLVSRGAGIGVLSIYRKEPHEWLTHEVRFATTIAGIIANAIAKMQLFNTVSEGKRWVELVLNRIADGVVTTDQECRIRSFNPAAEDITGWSADEVVGHHFCEVFGARDECARRCSSQKCSHREALTSTSPDPPMRRIPFTRQDGAELTLAITTARLSSQPSEFCGTVTVFRDVSKEERLDRVKSDFVSIVSHELRAPLASIMAAVDLLKRGGLDSRSQQEVIDILYSQSRRLSRLVEDVLSISRFDAEEIDIQLRPVALRPLLWRTVDVVRAERGNYQFEVHLQDNLPYILADEGKLEIVLQNLLANALQYSRPGGEITVEAREIDDTIVISIADEGVGISPEDQEHIFERYYRAETTESRQVKGHGLGLYLCKKLVEAQGGRIWLESEQGVGSRFSFSLPSFRAEGEESDHE